MHQGFHSKASQVCFTYRWRWAPVVWAVICLLVPGVVWLLAVRSGAPRDFLSFRHTAPEAWPALLSLWLPLLLALGSLLSDAIVHQFTHRYGYTVRIDQSGIWLFDKLLLSRQSLRCAHFPGFEPKDLAARPSGTMLIELKGDGSAVTTNPSDWRLWPIDAAVYFGAKQASFSLDLRYFHITGELPQLVADLKQAVIPPVATSGGQQAGADNAAPDEALCWRPILGFPGMPAVGCTLVAALYLGCYGALPYFHPCRRKIGNWGFGHFRSHSPLWASPSLLR